MREERREETREKDLPDAVVVYHQRARGRGKNQGFICSVEPTMVGGKRGIRLLTKFI